MRDALQDAGWFNPSLSMFRCLTKVLNLPTSTINVESHLRQIHRKYLHEYMHLTAEEHAELTKRINQANRGKEKEVC